MIPALLVPSVRPRATFVGGALKTMAGNATQLTLRQYLIGGGFLDSNTGVAWSSSNPGVATVTSSTGVVVAVAAGSTTLTASYSGLLFTNTVTVYADELSFVRAVWGDSRIKAIYSAAGGVTGTTEVSAWADLRGGGFGPTFTNAIGTGPTLVGTDPTTRYLDFAGGKAMIASGFAGFSQSSSISLLVVSTLASSSGIIADMTAPIGTDADMAITSGGGGIAHLAGHITPGDQWIEGNAIRYPSARWRLTMASRDTTALSGRVESFPLTAGIATISTGANLGNGDRIFLNANGSSGNEKMRALVVLTGAYST